MTVIFGDMNWTVRLLTISQAAEPDYRAFGNQESFLIAQTYNNDISRSQRQAMPIRGGHFNAARLEHQQCAVQRVARLLVWMANAVRSISPASSPAGASASALGTSVNTGKLSLASAASLKTDRPALT